MYKRTIIFTTAAFSCGMPPKPTHELKSEIPASHHDHAVLGQAYDSTKMRLLNIKCAEGEISTELGNQEASFKLNIDKQFSEIINTIGGNLSIGAQFPMVRAGASASLAKDMAATEYTSTYNFNWNITPKKKVFLPSSFNISKTGKSYLLNMPKKLQEKCGDEFITAISYGASLDVNMKIEYRNPKDKLAIGGQIHVNIGQLKDIVKVDGALDHLDASVKKSVKITIQARQTGGDPLQLLKVVPGKLISCTLENPKPCFEVFTAAIHYAKNDVMTQFESPQSYNIVKYTTQRYDESGLDELVPAVGYKEVSPEIMMIRYEIEHQLQDALLDQSRAANILSAYREWLTSKHYKVVKDIAHKASYNGQLLTTASIFCYNKPHKNCMLQYDKVKSLLQIYDNGKLSIPTYSQKTSSELCAAARHTALRYQLIQKRFADAYESQGKAPIFHDYKKPRQGILKWKACHLAALTYKEKL